MSRDNTETTKAKAQLKAGVGNLVLSVGAYETIQILEREVAEIRKSQNWDETDGWGR